VGQFRKDDAEIIISLMGSSKKWADLRALIQKGFELSGTPIAKMEPQEERLWFAKKHAGRYAGATSGTGKLKGRSKAVLGSAGSLPSKKKASKKKNADGS
jgi:hypothetical protein